MTAQPLDLTGHWAGYLCLALFAAAYGLVILEETLHLRKSKPVMVAAGLIWMLVAWVYGEAGVAATATELVRHNLLEFAELFLFLLAAMTYINTMEDLGVFRSLRAWLVRRGFSLRAVFWITGALAFFISPFADNLTTALVMTSVVTAVAPEVRSFVVVGCINVVVAANAGGAFSPFGDITTLMVWQKGVVEFHEFFDLFLPAAINWLVPAVLMAFAVPAGHPAAVGSGVRLRPEAIAVIALFIFTIAIAVAVHNYLHLPPVVGMMTGLGLLKLYDYCHHLRPPRAGPWPPVEGPEAERRVPEGDAPLSTPSGPTRFDVFKAMERVEWDTLMFFYGIILCVGGLGALGYLGVLSQALYGGLGATTANILIGVLSAVIDNIPLMFAVLSMEPDMSHGQWLLVTLTAGVGGSLLSIGSAAGVGVMGQARGIYTFGAHLRWSWAIALGYVASIATHCLLNADLM
jgi:Na+/H+ antiporter NhaD/arsenite permease-like protein